MNRTRLIFFVLLGILLAILATSLATSLMSVPTLTAVYAGSAVFGVGVVLMDFLGILGGHHGDGDMSGGAVHDAGDLGHGHVDAADLHGGHLDAASAGVDHAAGEAGGGGDGGHHADGHADGHAEHAHAGHSAAPVLSALAYLRLLVYFCLGFGPTGWASLLAGRSALGSLVLAVPVGLGALLLAQAIFRWQRHDTDSQLTASDLLARSAVVTVPLDARTMGKVRIQVGPNVTEQYALAARPGAAFEKGEEVRIIKVTDECVLVG